MRLFWFNIIMGYRDLQTKHHIYIYIHILKYIYIPESMQQALFLWYAWTYSKSYFYLLNFYFVHISNIINYCERGGFANELTREFLLTSYGKSNECAKIHKNGRRTIFFKPFFFFLNVESISIMNWPDLTRPGPTVTIFEVLFLGNPEDRNVKFWPNLYSSL